MDSRKPLTAVEIEEIETLVGNHYATWESDDKEAAATYLARLLSMLTPPPDAAVREAVERLEKVAYFKVRSGEKMVDAHPHLSILLRAVQAPRLTGEQLDAVQFADAGLELAKCNCCAPGFICSRCAAQNALRVAFHEVFGDQNG